MLAGLAEGKSRGSTFNDGDFYKFLEGAAATLAATNSARINEKLDEVIGVIAQAQETNGYIDTWVQLHQREGDTNASPFSNPENFEMYNFGHLLTAACVHYRVTGKTNFLAVARKAADFLVRRIPKSNAGAGEQFNLPVALHGHGRIVSRDRRAALSGTGGKIPGDARIW